MSFSITETPNFALGGSGGCYWVEGEGRFSKEPARALGSVLEAFACTEAGEGGVVPPFSPGTWSLSVIHSVVQCGKM